MPGPLPNPNARRRNAGSGFTVLPAEGRPGPPPPHPMAPLVDPIAQGRREELWAELWALPAAVLWERGGWTRTVARYAELTAAWEADPGSTSVAMLAELRHLEGRLALSTDGLLRVRAVISDATGATVHALHAVTFLDVTDGDVDPEPDQARPPC